MVCKLWCMYIMCPVTISKFIGLLYTYLAQGAGNTTGRGAFRALKKGYVHRSSGRLDNLEVNLKHPHFFMFVVTCCLQ